MLFKKLLRTMRLYRAQFISMIIMIVLGVGIFVGFNMEWVSIEDNMASFFEESNYADYKIISESGFSKDELEKIENISGVKSASRYLSVNADVKEREGDSLAMTVTENENVSGFVLMDGEEYNSASEDGIWLSDIYASKNDVKIGDKLTLVYKNFEVSGTVKGLIKAGEYMICVRDETQLMPDYTTYGYAFISPALYKKTVGMDFYPQINVISDDSRKQFENSVDDALGKTTLILSKDESTAYAQAKGESDEGKTMGSVLPPLFLLIAVLTMVTTMQRLTAKEKTQIGTLKALGFKDRRILAHYTSYAFSIGIVGSVLGTALGYLIAWYIMNPNGAMGTYLDMPYWRLRMPLFCIIIVVAIILILTLIGFLCVKKILHGTAADALRPYEPKRMKALLIERTNGFHKLSFGTRWNLRDVMRHKSRTAMTLIGIIGCTLLVVGSLGMRDTMSAFLDMYYDGAIAYSSRIYVAEGTTKEQCEALADKYDGDWSSSVSVKHDEKTLSLDIYNIEHDKVKFPDENTDYIKIGSDGAYVCMRIADEFGLKAGDTFKISPYGSDKEYELKIAGLIRSVTESIVISPEYAEKLDIPYNIDSIYTSTEKSDIASDSLIKSVQTKQSIVDSFDTFTEIQNMMIGILVVAALGLGMVVLYNLGVMSYTERYREMATLKVVGFRDKKIGKLLIGQNMWLTLIGVIIGIPCGLETLSYLVSAMAGEYEMNTVVSWKTYFISALLTFGVSLIVSLMVARKNRKIDMVEALKSAE